MQITLNLKGYGETKLSVLPLDKKDSDNTAKEFVLVYCEKDIANPFMTLRLNSDNIFEIINQREIDR